jgi:hypothetical protein
MQAHSLLQGARLDRIIQSLGVYSRGKLSAWKPQNHLPSVVQIAHSVDCSMHAWAICIASMHYSLLGQMFTGSVVASYDNQVTRLVCALITH